MSWTSWKGDQVIKMFDSECKEAIRDAVNATGSYIDDNTVPHDEGHLTRSKHVEDDPTDTAVWIGYGGGGISGYPVVPYAKWWHENPANFQKGRTHNYLRQPMQTKYPEYLRRALNQKGLTLS